VQPLPTYTWDRLHLPGREHRSIPVLWEFQLFRTVVPVEQLILSTATPGASCMRRSCMSSGIYIFQGARCKVSALDGEGCGCHGRRGQGRAGRFEGYSDIYTV